MTTQPLTPGNAEIVMVGASLIVINDELRKYGIPTDAGNVEPVITIHKIASYDAFKALLLQNPSPTTPWCIAGPSDNVPAILRMSAEAYFGTCQTVASALSMKINETLMRKPEL